MIAIIEVRNKMTVTFIKCKTATEFMKELSPENEKFNPLKNFIFRGQGANTGKLTPSLLREKKKNNQKWWEIERDLLLEFVSYCDKNGIYVMNDSVTLREGVKKDYDINKNDPRVNYLKGTAQHYGVPTTLLDWTQHPFISAWFAASTSINKSDKEYCKTKGVSEIVVWALNTNDLQDSLIRLPGATCPNLAAQEGVFTCFLNDKKDYEDNYVLDYIKEFEKEEYEAYQITLPSKHSKDVLEICEKYRITGATLFPGLKGAADETMLWHKIRTSNKL